MRNLCIFLLVIVGIVACSEREPKAQNWILPNDYYNASRENWEWLADLPQTCDGVYNLCWFVDPKTGDNAFPGEEFEVTNIFNEGLAAVRVDGKFGYIDGRGSIVIEPKFQLAGPFLGGLAEIVINNSAGLIDREGNIVLEPKYHTATHLSGGVLVIREQIDLSDLGVAPRVRRNIPLFLGKYYRREVSNGQLFKLGEGLISDEKFTFEFLKTGPLNLQDPDPGFVWAKPSDSEHYGLMSVDGRWKISPRFASVFPPDNQHGFTKVVDADGRYGIVDFSGEWLVPLQFGRIFDFKNGYFVAKKQSSYGLIDLKGELVGRHYFSEVDVGDTNWSPRVKEGGQWFQFDSEGRRTADTRDGEWMVQCSDGLSVRFKGDGIEFVKKNGGLVEGGVFSLSYYSVDDCEFPFLASLSGNSRRIHRNGELGNIAANQVWEDSSGQAVVLHRGEWVSGNDVPKIYQPLAQSSAELECSGGTKRIKVDGKWGIVDRQGRMLVPARYKVVSCYANGAAWAANDSRSMWCQIGRSGEFTPNGTCREEVYPYRAHHEVPVSMHPDPYESSVLWYRAYLDYLSGETSRPPNVHRDR